MNGWVTSGVDWDDIGNNRLEAVIYHLYQAVKERDYWYKTLSKYPETQVINPLIYRSINQLRYIYNTLNNWFMPFSEYDSILGSDRAGLAIFINEDNTANGSESSAYLGKGNIDLDKLSEMLGKDVTYISDGVGVDRFVELSQLKDIYDILNLNLKNRFFIEEKGFSGVRFRSVRLNPVNGGDYIVTRGVDYFGSDADFSTAISNFNSNNNPSPTSVNYLTCSTSIFKQSPSDPYVIFQTVVYMDFKLTGFDDQEYTPLNFDVVSYSYVDTSLTIATSTPQLVDGDEYIYSNIEEPNPGFFTLSTDTLFKRLSEDKVIITETTEDEYLSRERLMPFLDINKEGFLKYYTEPTN